ncbi:hypothetical protein QR680_001950 [Steinernema hermaphroditum]|uniref:Neurotransmitter-gated ion-channel ligand-binding domain-containing protein n=1 Tax=Steinernema hermaphroditum TaxID=289476 RepID=A0AA39H1F8_9BILA|nr:hypothetical protein QR680_001950 [Steinernema hermaphroditum]
MAVLLLCAAFVCGVILISPGVGAGYKGLEGQLYEDLLYDYNKIPRPVKNSTDVLMVDVGASLIRIIDVDEKNQVLTTNLWLEMKWVDAKLQWDPKKYGGITTLHIPSDLIWTPDLVLYNNAAGDPDITIFTDALVAYDGRVFWQPPAIYKSFCPIDVTWFPYDLQNCNMKFGAWSYTGYYVDLRQLPSDQVILTKDSDGSDVEFMENGMDLSFFYKSAEWDLLSLTSARHSVLYASCCGPEKYVDITYYLVLRRKTLFFTCNLIIPCFLISLLTTFVFYLVLMMKRPDHNKMKNMEPNNGLVEPSALITPHTENCRPRPSVHKAERREKLPNIEMNSYVFSRPSTSMHVSSFDSRTLPCYSEICNNHPNNNRSKNMNETYVTGQAKDESVKKKTRVKDQVHDVIFTNLLQQVRFVAEHFKRNEQEAEVSDDWTFVAMVLDRLFLIIFSVLNVATFFIILEAPSLYDTREPLNITCSLLMAIQDDMKCYILLTVLMCPHVIYAFFFGILRKIQLRNTDFRLLHTMSMKEIIGLESSFWMILMLLSGALTLSRFVAMYSNGSLLIELLELTFVLGPLTIAFVHPFLLLWHNICVRNSAIRICPSLRAVMPLYEPVTPPMPRRVHMNNSYGNGSQHPLPVIRMSV